MNFSGWPAHAILWLSFLAVLSCVLTQPERRERQSVHRRLITFDPVLDLGNSSYLPHVTVFAAVVHLSHAHNEGLLFSTGPNAHQRANVEKLQQSLPMPLRYWPAIGAKSCPQYGRSLHRYDKGHVASHFQVWADFVFFDHDVLEARFRPTPEFVASTSYSSISGQFVAFPNGTLYKNGLLYLESDILIMLEDNLHINQTLAADFADVLRETLADRINATDVLRLGHCQHQSHGSGGRLPWCQFAYAVTRKACRKLLEHIDLCGRSLDQQIQFIEKLGHISVDVVESSLFYVRNVTIVHS